VNQVLKAPDEHRPDQHQPEVAGLLRASETQQKQAGYFHTLREILQQPALWLDTCDRMIGHGPELAAKLAGMSAVVVTGSGSSHYAGECVCQVLQQELGIAVEAVDGGALLTHGGRAIAPGRPALMVSLARSGDSPESVGAVSLLLETEPGVRHLVLTCNGNGGLARRRNGEEGVQAVVLDPRTNDRSLVMTSSFTNLVLAARFLGLHAKPECYRAICAGLSALCSLLLTSHTAAIAGAARSGFRRAVFLGSGPNFGAAQEAALKMLEMTGGRVPVMRETYLGLRHGPMSFVHEDTLLVCFLSCDPLLRQYESDLIRELNRKKLGSAKLLIGERIGPDLLAAGDTAIELPGMAKLGDANTPVLHVVAGQLLAFFRCRQEGLRPDSPSEDGVISRVVEEFPLHRDGQKAGL
jgi:tagatose-6-phosphate ketose/aldose isomerase